MRWCTRSADISTPTLVGCPFPAAPAEPSVAIEGTLATATVRRHDTTRTARQCWPRARVPPYNASMNTLSELIRQDRVMDLGPLPAPRLAPNATVHQALQFLTRGRRGAIVVVEGLRPVGIFTERDVLVRLGEDLSESREEQMRSALRDVMSQPVVTVRRQDSLHAAIEKMVDKRIRHLVVVDRHGDLQGLLTTNDLVQFLTDQFPEDTLNLPPRLHQQYTSREGA